MSAYRALYSLGNFLVEQHAEFNRTGTKSALLPRRLERATSIVGRPGLFDDAGAVAQRDLGVGPVLDRGGEGGAGEEEVRHAGEVLVKVRPGGVAQRSMLWAWWGMSGTPD